VRVFFLICVIIAGIFGAVTVNRRIMFVQAIPAAVTLFLVVLAG
jgi:putative membrane protein